MTQGEHMLQRMLQHELVAVLQAMVRGWQVRSWFRHNLANLRQYRSSREQFARLASIGRVASLRRTRSSQSDASADTDMLAQQVRSPPVATLACRARQFKLHSCRAMYTRMLSLRRSATALCSLLPSSCRHPLQLLH